MRNEIELEILAKRYLRDVLRRECWESLKVKGKAIKVRRICSSTEKCYIPFCYIQNCVILTDKSKWLPAVCLRPFIQNNRWRTILWKNKQTKRWRTFAGSTTWGTLKRLLQPWAQLVHRSERLVFQVPGDVAPYWDARVMCYDRWYIYCFIILNRRQRAILFQKLGWCNFLGIKVFNGVYGYRFHCKTGLNLENNWMLWITLTSDPSLLIKGQM